MALSHDLISQFAKLVNSDKKASGESTIYGEITVDASDNKYVRVDGSDQLIPIEDGNTVVDANPGERVSVQIKNHSATVTGNVSSPAARSGDVQDLGEEIKQFDIVIAKKIQANEAYFKRFLADEVKAGNLTVAEATVVSLVAEEADIEKLKAGEIDVTNIIATKLDVDVADALFANIKNLTATNATVNDLVANYATFSGKLTAFEGDFNSLKAKAAVLDNLDSKYAYLDFTNIKEADIQSLFARYGIIQELTGSSGTFTKQLVGVLVKGDLIEAGTLKVDRLIVRGSDGNYYALNTDFSAMPGVEPVAEDAIHGSVLVEKSIVAEKISVDDLVAFGATIGRFKIEDAMESYVVPIEDIPAITDTIQASLDLTAKYSILPVLNELESYIDEFDLSDDDRTSMLTGLNAVRELIANKEYINIVNAFNQNVVVPAMWTGVVTLEKRARDILRYNLMIELSRPAQYKNYIENATPLTSSFVKHISEYIERMRTLYRTSANIPSEDIQTANGYLNSLEAFVDVVIAKGSPGRIYSGAKASVDSDATPGIYMDSIGQFNVGNLKNHLKFYKDETGEWKLGIRITGEEGRDYNFTDNGLKVSKTASESGVAIETTVDHDGLEVKVDGNISLSATEEGVEAKDLKATTYLLIGDNSRLETYKGTRTACFWIGGN